MELEETVFWLAILAPSVSQLEVGVSRFVFQVLHFLLK
jgi:hypothetical protein